MTQIINDNVQQDSSTSLLQFIERLKPLHVILAQNSYVKDTSRRLKRLIEDAENQMMILILGKERVGKTTLINGLLGRELLSASNTHPTSTNTFIRYGEEECVKAVFLDGMIATFDITKIELLTTSDAFIGQIIREHLDYIEVYLKHDLLKEATIVDSTALEIGADNSAYFSQSLISRVDEIFWVLRSGSIATEAEVKFLNKLNVLGIKPYFIINAIDHFEGNISDFMNAEKGRYGEQIEAMFGVSALKAIEARKTNNTQLLIDSRYTELTQLIQQLVNNQQKKTRHITERFINWLTRLRKEIELIPEREPYLSAVQSIEKFGNDTGFEFSRQQRDMAIISSYEEEYRHVSEVFKGVQTLYQLLQVLASELYLRDEQVERFEARAVRYQQAVREYRKLHSDYVIDYTRFEKQYKKIVGKSLKSPIELDDSNGFAKERVASLNKQQAICVEKLELIENHKNKVIDELYLIQNHLTDLAMKRMKQILTQVGELNVQRKREQVVLKSYADKLAEFNCIVEAQGFVREALLPYALGDALPLSDEEKKQLRNTVECICAVDLTHEGLYNRLSFTKSDADVNVQVQFEVNYQIVGLSLTEADVISDLPELPATVEIVTVEVTE